MWTPLTDCGRQLTIHSKIRETDENYVALYEIAEVEFDQYKLRLLERNNQPEEKTVEMKLACRQLIHYQFEVEQKQVAFSK
jgi:hypothetical protein